jgi:SAM-dependent methyltransferase
MKYIISFVTRFIPRHILQLVAHRLLQIYGLFLRGNRFEDPIDGTKYRKLLPYGRINSRKNALAPNTLSLERHRLLWLFFKQKTNLFTEPVRLLHVAPEYCFIKRFKSQKNISYVAGDIISPLADVRMDVRHIPFPDDSFEVAICNHVLEHVDEDLKAMQEFFRVLKPGGWGVFQVPIDFSRDTTLENPAFNTPELREKHYWQRDHVRLYGRDYGKRLAEAGFEVTEDYLVMELDPKLAERYALPMQEIIYYCQKPF